jgi:hypothetical protein
VSEKTIRRDLAAFQEVGQRADCKRFDEEDDVYRWFYKPGVKPLFREPPKSGFVGATS